MRTKNSVWLTLVLICLIGAALRFHKLGLNSFWVDEVDSYLLSSGSLPDIFHNIGTRPHPPLYFIMLHFVIKLFGHSEAAMRLPSAAGGLASIIAVYFLGRRLFSDKEGLIASALTAVLWYPVFYGRDARAYSLLILFAALSVYFWIPLARSVSEKKSPPLLDTACYFVSALVASQLHYFGAFFVILQGLTGFWTARKWQAGRLYFLLVYATIFVYYVPLIPAIAAQYDTLLSHPAYIAFIPKPAPLAFFGYLSEIFKQGYEPLYVFVLIMYAFFLCNLFYDAFAKRSPKEVFTLSNPDFLVFCWLAVPFAVVQIISTVFLPILYARYLIILFPAACLILARSIVLLRLKPSHLAVFSSAVVYLLVLHLVFVRGHFTVQTFWQYRDAVNAVCAYDPRLKNSMIAFTSEDETAYEYYFEKNSFKKDFLLIGNNKEAEAKKAVLAAKPNYLWLLSSTGFGHNDKRLKTIYKGADLVFETQYPLVNVKLLKFAYPR